MTRTWIHPRVGELLDAVSSGDLDLTRRLIDEGCPVDAVAENRDTALKVAVTEGRVEVVALLLGLGADPEQLMGSAHDFYALQVASMQGSKELISALLNGGARANGRAHSKKPTPLRVAVTHGRDDAVQLLLAYGADADGAGVEPGDAVDEACARGHRNILELLIAHGASVDSGVLERARRRIDSAGTAEEAAVHRGMLDVLSRRS